MAHCLEESSSFDAVSALLDRSVKNCHFQFLSTEQAKSLSVVRITQPEAFDAVGQPTENGVHDPRMGMYQSRVMAICPTCQLTMAQGCPGHLGHIQLHSEAYNPYLLQSLVNLLRMACVHCGKFRLHESETAHFVRKFACLSRGKTPPDLQFAVLDTKKSQRALDRDIDAGWNDDETITTLDILLEDHINETRTKETLPHRTAEDHKKSAASLRNSCIKSAERKRAKREEEARDVVENLPVIRETEVFPSFWQEQWRITLKDFALQTMKLARCQNCEEKASKFKQSASTRIYLQDPEDKERSLFCPPVKIREYVKKIWEAEKEMVPFLFPGAKEAADQFFFVEALLVTPNCFRPQVGGAGTIVLATETQNIIRILEENEKLAQSLKEKEDDNPEAAENDKQQRIDQFAVGYVQLQEAVNVYYDSSKGTTKQLRSQRGIRQLLERKEGLFRSKMMGKRVNFAARSVISPDNNLEGNEIGLPPHIVKTLAYPEPVTPHNVARMRRLVENGMEEYPGASYVLELTGTGENRCIDLKFVNKQKRQALAQKLLVGLESGEPPFIVYRNLVNGDPVLMNRQPTLHKPGIMAHKVRVLHGEKTIRMHYVNCNTYNADFDGDEMNCHSPQDPISRIEALSIALTDCQYLVPTSGKPLRGLIQDHVVGGVFLCARDTFLTQEQASHLLYKGLRNVMEGDYPKHMVEIPSLSSNNVANERVQRPRANPKRVFRFVWDEPCIMKPKLWSGKQVLSMVMKSLLRQHGWHPSALFHTAKSKTPGDIWNGSLDGNKEEEKVIFRATELLCGVLDKSSFGAAQNGLVHLCYEIFGPAVASRTLSVFAKLFTTFLSMKGFTCAMSDFLVDKPSETVRAGLIENTHKEGLKAIEQFVQEDGDCVNEEKGGSTDITWKLKDIFARKQQSMDLLDSKMLGVLRELWGKTIDACLPAGQLVPFPKNCFSCMIQTGAKGSKINQSQISCLMGQQELEGRRVPLLASRRSLPSFAPFDFGARAGGYITDRFLTGIRPQEYFFHCMAGREGLVDTAVKTSRSGYLQRCLVKHLETLVVGYDHTVRDVSDGSVVQFLYGEDGLDVMKTPHLTEFEVARENASESTEEALAALRKSSADTTGLATRYQSIISGAYNGLSRKKMINKMKKLRDDCQNTYPELTQHLHMIREELKADKAAPDEGWVRCLEKHLDPVTSLFSPGSFFGSISEEFHFRLIEYLENAPMSDEEKRVFLERMHLRYQKALAAPGEAVGVIAAQGMGEPSTQMTLNTFHLAGHGGANVTLGIPRLREIVQTASKSITTPYMKVFFKQTPSGKTDFKSVRAYASHVASLYRKTLMKDLVKEIRITEVMTETTRGRARTYTIDIEFEDLEFIASRLPYVTKKVIEETLTVGTHSYAHRLNREVQKILSVAQANTEEGVQKSVATKSMATQDAANVKPVEDGEKMEDEGNKDDAGDDALPSAKRRKVNKRSKAGRRTGIGSDVESESSEDDVTDAESEEEQGKHADAGEAAKMDTESGDEKETRREAAEDEDMDDDDEDFAYVRGSTFQENTFSIKVVVKLSASGAKILLSEVASSLLESMYVQNPDAKGLNTLHVRDEKREVYIETEGINVLAFWSLPDECVCTERIYTNCIGTMISIYGVESCRQSIVAEIRNVFNHYGIEVNYRHVFLIADYMTHHGGYRACNRLGMLHAASPFLQMSFETSMGFCTTAAIEGLSDSFASPSGSVVIGSAPKVGSNSFSVLCDMNQQKTSLDVSERDFKFC